MEGKDIKNTSDLCCGNGRASNYALHCCWKWRQARSCQNIHPQQNDEKLTASVIVVPVARNLISKIVRHRMISPMKIPKVFWQKYGQFINEIYKIARWRLRRRPLSLRWLSFVRSWLKTRAAMTVSVYVAYLSSFVVHF